MKISYPDENNEFPLTDGSHGNPGCDECGSEDAVIKVDNDYLCARGARDRGIMIAQINRKEAHDK